MNNENPPLLPITVIFRLEASLHFLKVKTGRKFDVINGLTTDQEDFLINDGDMTLVLPLTLFTDENSDRVLFLETMADLVNKRYKGIGGHRAKQENPQRAGS